MVAVLCRLPDVPVIVMLDAPAAAALVAVKVSVLVSDALAALNAAVTPGGSPETARATALLKPFCEAMLMVLLIEPPGATLTFAGVADRLNVAVVVMVSARRVVLVRLPEVPVIVIVAVAAAAEALAVSVRVLEVVALAGLNDAVTPAGSPDTARLTAPPKPCCGLMAMVLRPLCPAGTESVEADKDRLNAGALEVPAKVSISGWPEGLPHPVARS
jgi:hypothetical protein